MELNEFGSEGYMASQNRKPFEKRRLLVGDDPHGFKLRDHPRNQAAVRIALNHEQKCRKSGFMQDLMDDTPEGDVACGLCCSACDYIREFPYIGQHLRQVT